MYFNGVVVPHWIQMGKQTAQSQNKFPDDGTWSVMYYRLVFLCLGLPYKMLSQSLPEGPLTEDQECQTAPTCI